MLQRLIAFSLRNGLLVLLAASAVLALGVYTAREMPVDVFPELNAPTVIILTEAGGLAADEVEQYVTFPIETSLNGLTGVRRVRSGSAISLSIIYVEFDWGTDIYRARQQVGERLAAAQERLPKNTHTEIAPITGITGEIMLLSLAATDPKVKSTELRAYAEYNFASRLMAVPGVAQVVAIGGELPEYQVNVRQERLRLYDLTTEEVADAARKAHSTESAGYIPNVGGLELPVRQAARVRSVEDVKATVIKFRNGSPVTIGQVADVEMAGAPKRGTASEGGRPAVVLSIQKSPNTNTIKLTDEIDRALDSAEKGLPAGMQLNRHVMRQADFINISLRNVLHVLRDAAILVTIVVVLFLLNFRTAVITLTALPLSLAVSLLILWALGLSINVMTLGGLAVAIGELVDDAIIDVENVFRRLRENALLPARPVGVPVPSRAMEAEEFYESDAAIAARENATDHAHQYRKPFLRVIFDASNEIRSAVVFATVIIVIVFVPLLFLQGLEGRFFRPLGIAYIASILASLIVALTVTPAMCRFLLRGKLGNAGHKDSFLVRWLKAVYAPTLRVVLRLRWAVVGVAVVITALSVWLAGTFGTEFLPRFNEGTITVFLTAPPGTSMEESDRLATAVDQKVMGIPGVRAVVRRTGRAERDAHAEPPNRSETEIGLTPGVRREDVLPEIDKIIGELPGISAETGQPMEHRLSHILSGTPAAIAINVFGEDLPTLRKIAREVEAVVRTIPGTRDVAGNREATVVSVPIRYRHEDLARVGLTPADAAHQVRDALAGEVVAEVNDGVRRYDLTVRLHPDERSTVEQIRQILLRGQGGALVRLEEVADVVRENAPMGITRENARRKAVVSTNVAEGYNLGHLVAQVQAKVDPIVHKYGYAVTYGGQFEAQQSAAKTIYVMGAGVAVVILILLYIALGTFRAALLVMVNLPLALVGGIAAIYWTESEGVWRNTAALLGMGEGRYRPPVISIASMVGFVTLFGIAVRNGILLVDHYNNLLREGKPLREAIVTGSMERLVPILMTALAAVLGLVPLAMAAGEPGSELLAPLAIVVLGGLVTSTLLNLIVVPAGYAMVFRLKQHEAQARRPGPSDQPPRPVSIEPS
ncbi:MAG: efflux RND transporter permease subunit [Phycisphaerae bacterium]